MCVILFDFGPLVSNRYYYLLEQYHQLYNYAARTTYRSHLYAYRRIPT